MADVMRTVTNDAGDVCTFVQQEGKYTLFTFDAETGRSYIETLVKLPDTSIWAYMVTESYYGTPYHTTWSNGGAVSTVEAWQDTQGYVDALNGKF